MREFDSFGEFADYLEGLIPLVPIAEHEALQQSAHIVAEKAKRLIGGGHPSWPALAEATLDTKARLGYAIPYPLLRTGEMRESISYTFVSPLFVEVGSTDQKAVWHELGTSKMPPRPFLSTAAIESEDEIVSLVGRGVYLVLLGTRTH